MISAVKHLEETHKGICNAIESKRMRITQMEESLTDTKLRLLDLIEEASAIRKAIEVLSEGDSLPIRLEGSK